VYPFTWLEGISTNAPPGFVLSPADAARIYAFVGSPDNSWPSIIYADSVSYYLLEAFPERSPCCSYYAKKNGLRIHGRDGSVFDPVFGWQQSGYVHMTASEFMTAVPTGTTHQSVIERFGHDETWPLWNVETNTDGRKTEILTYLLRDGRLNLLFFDGRLAIRTTAAPVDY